MRGNIKLEHLENHLINCEYNSNSEIVCDKGCEIKMSRREYATQNCYAHLKNRMRVERVIESTRQNEEISKLTEQLHNQRMQNTKLNDEVNGLAEQITKLNEKVNCLEQQIENDEISKFGDNSNISLNAPLKWNIFSNFKISADKVNILEQEGNGDAFAQSFYSIFELKNFCFKVQILQAVGFEIGLSSKDHAFGFRGINVRSVVCDNEGYVYIDGENLGCIGHILKASDVVECGIKSTGKFTSDGSPNITVYFCLNGRLFIERTIKIPTGGLFPAVKTIGGGFIMPNKLSFYS